MLRTEEHDDIFLENTKLKTMIYETQLLYNERSKNKQFDLLKDMSFDTYALLSFQLNKLITTNISKKKIQKDVEIFHKVSSLSDLYDYLENKSTGKDYDIGVVKGFAERFDKDIHDFILQIATKSVPLRIGIPTVNKFFDKMGFELIPDFSVQLANNIDKLKQNDIDNLNDIFVTEKLDGVRVIAQYIVSDHSFKLFSRSGKEFIGFDEIIEEFNNNLDKTYVYDGELLAENQANKAEDTFRLTMKIVGAKQRNKTGVVFNMFDMVPIDDFLKGGTDYPYAIRRDWLDNLVGELYHHIKAVPVLMHTDDFEDIKNEFNELVSNGAEGVMLNKGNAPYLTKRNNGILKYKQVYDSEGIVRDIFEGQGEAKGTMGGIIVQYHDTTVRVGTGFTEEQRIDFWNNPDKIINKLAQYRYTSVSHNQNDDGVSLRFARFITLRNDKTEQSFDN